MSKIDVAMLALGWFLVLEGLTPMVAPEAWKRMVSRLAESPDQALRFTGAALVALGLVIVWIV